MKKTVIFYGLALASLVAALKYLEYRYFVRSLSAEVYIGLLVTLFTGLGIWIGLKLTAKPASQAAPPAGFQPQFLPQANPAAPEMPVPGLAGASTFGISSRELEVLELMAQGFTNQQIADRLFVSLNTVKTHAANVYAKLDVNRRTQAIQKARELKIIK